MIPIRDIVPSHRPPVMTILIIAVNVTVHLILNGVLMSVSPGEQERWYAMLMLVPAAVTGGPDAPTFLPWTLVTHMFVHANLLHILGNMWFLWLFGDNVEDRMGPVRFLVFYLATGLAAAGTHIALGGSSTVPMLGASGAIGGVMGAYIVLYPRARIVMLIPFIIPFFMEWPALVFLGLWFVGEFLGGIKALGNSAGAEVGGVAFWAHVGGFVAGVVLHRFLMDRRSTRPAFDQSKYLPGRPRVGMAGVAR